MAEEGITSPGEITVYGSFTAPYAVYVHEILENRHDWPTKAKFLEDPANRRAAVLISNLRRKLLPLMQGISTPGRFSSPYAFRRDYKAWQQAHTSARQAKSIRGIGHLGGRFI